MKKDYHNCFWHLGYSVRRKKNNAYPKNFCGLPLAPLTGLSGATDTEPPKGRGVGFAESSVRSTVSCAGALGKVVSVSGRAKVDLGVVTVLALFWTEYELTFEAVPQLRLAEDAGLPPLVSGNSFGKPGTEKCAWGESSFLLYGFQNVDIRGKYVNKLKPKMKRACWTAHLFFSRPFTKQLARFKIKICEVHRCAYEFHKLNPTSYFMTSWTERKK